MGKPSQVGIIAIVLGAVITVIGLFPAIVGFSQSPGIRILKTLTILIGVSVLVFGAYVFVQATYYPGVRHNLIQQITLRLSQEDNPLPKGVVQGTG